MKISGANGTISSADLPVNGARAARRGSTGEIADTVQLSAASSELASANAEPTIDRARVSEIRQAIAEGRLQINPGAIADRLIASARELVGTQPKG